MSEDRILAIDIGAGTMDVLLHDPAQPMENAVQLSQAADPNHGLRQDRPRAIH